MADDDAIADEGCVVGLGGELGTKLVDAKGSSTTVGVLGRAGCGVLTLPGVGSGRRVADRAGVLEFSFSML
jgi:hypothetical protein